MKISPFAIALVPSLSAVAAADAQTNVRIRGTITAIDGNVMSVKARDGRDVRVRLAENLTVAVAKAARFEDIKAGDYVGATGKREVSLRLKGDVHTIAVREGTPIVRSVPGARADLMPGEYVFVAAQAATDGALTAARVQISKDEVRPGQ